MARKRKELTLSELEQAANIVNPEDLKKLLSSWGFDPDREILWFDHNKAPFCRILIQEIYDGD